MKIKLVFIPIIFLCSCLSVTAQVCVPEQAEIFWSKAMNEINPNHTRWIRSVAADIRSGKTTVEEVQGLATTYAQLGKLGDADITALAFLVMMEAAKSAREDLKAIMEGIKAMNKQKQALREALDYLKKIKSEKKLISRATYDSLKKVLAYDSLKNIAPAAMQPVKQVARSLPVTAAEFTELIDAYRDKLDSLNEISEMQSLRLQMIMDRLSKLMSTISNLFKKIGDTQSQVISNLK